MLPKIVKYLANGAMYDAVGDISTSYLSMYPTEDAIYFLMDTNGTVLKYNFQTREQSTVTTDYVAETHSIVVKDDIVYGFNGYAAKPFKDTSVMYILGDNELVEERYDRQTTTIILQSYTAINDFIVYDDLSYSVLHGDHLVSSFTKDRTSLGIYSLKSIDGLSASNPVGIAIDYIREYTLTGLKEYAIILGNDENYNLFVTKLSTNGFVETKFLGLTGNSLTRSNSLTPTYNMTNYTYLKNKHTDDTLTFKLKLNNIYDNRDVLDIEMPIAVTDFTNGEHHFAFRINSIEGYVDMFIDGRLYKKEEIPPGKYAFQTIVTDSIMVGCTNHYNSVPLFKYIQQKGYYFINDTVMRQFRLYNKALNESEIRFVMYNGLKMQDFVCQLPAGQHNAIDSIERQFKLGIPGNKSNNININIKNLGIIDETLQKQLKDAIKQKLSSIIPVNTHINSIKFNSYE